MSRILIIDDDEMFLQVMQGLLVDEGFEVLATADGPRGLELFKGHAPDLVLLDQALPSMNGLEVLRKIREIDSDAKVIMITGYGSEDSSQVALRYGAFDFLRKPVGANALLEKIHSALGM
jgi:DNA-binding response OmpR family regulator